MGWVEGTFRESISVVEEIFFILGSHIESGGIMLFQSSFKHFFEHIGRLLAVVTVTIDGSNFAYRIVQQGGCQSRLKLGLFLGRFLLWLMMKGILLSWHSSGGGYNRDRSWSDHRWVDRRLGSRSCNHRSWSRSMTGDGSGEGSWYTAGYRWEGRWQLNLGQVARRQRTAEWFRNNVALVLVAAARSWRKHTADDPSSDGFVEESIVVLRNSIR